MAHDIHSNIVERGDNVYALTSIHAGSKSKRLFFSSVVETTESKITVKAYETGRVVTLCSVSVIKPLEES